MKEDRDDGSYTTTGTAATEVNGLKRELEMRESMDVIKTQVVNNMVRDVKDKESKIKSLVATMKALEKRNADIEKKYKEMKVLAEESSTKCEKAEVASNAWEIASGNLTTQMEKLKESNNALSYDNAILKDAMSLIQKNLTDTLTEKKNLSDTKEVHELKIANLSKRVNELDASQCVLEIENGKLKKEIEQAQNFQADLVSKREHEVNSTSSTITSLLDSNEKLKRSMEDGHQRVLELEENNKRLERVNESLTQEVKDVQGQLDRNISAYVALTATNKDQEKTIVSVSSDFATLQAKERYYESFTKELKEELDESRRVHNDFVAQKEDEEIEYRSKIRLLQELSGRLEETVKINQQQIAELEKTEKVLEISNIQLKKEVGEAQGKHDEFAAKMDDEAKKNSIEITHLRKLNSELTQSLETSQQRASELEPRAKVLEIENKNLKEEIEEAKTNHDDIVAQKRHDANVYSSEITRLQEVNDKLTESVQNTNRLLQESKEENERKATAIEEHQLKTADLTRHISQLEKEIEDVQADNRVFKSRLNEGIKKNTNLGEHLAEEKKRFVSEIGYWKDMNEKLFESLGGAKDNLDIARNENEKLLAASQQMQLEMASLTEKLFDQETKAIEQAFELDSNIKTLQRANKKLTDKCNDLGVENTEKETNITELSKKISNVNDSNKDLESTIKDLNNKVQDLQKENSDLIAQLEEQRSKFAVESFERKEQYEKLEHSLQIVERKLTESNAANTKFIAEGEERREEIKFLKQKVISDLETDIKELEKENEILHDQLDEAKAQYSGLNGVIESSTKRLKKTIQKQDGTIKTVLKAKKELQAQLKDSLHKNNKQTQRILEMEKERQGIALKVLEHNVQHAPNPPRMFLLSEEVLSISFDDTDLAQEVQLSSDSEEAPDPLIQIPSNGVASLSPSGTHEPMAESNTQADAVVSSGASEEASGIRVDELEKTFSDDSTSDDDDNDDDDDESECMGSENEGEISLGHDDGSIGGILDDVDSDDDESVGDVTEGEDSVGGEETTLGGEETSLGGDSESDTVGAFTFEEEEEEDRPENEPDGWFWRWVDGENKQTMEEENNEGENTTVEVANKGQSDRPSLPTYA